MRSIQKGRGIFSFSKKKSKDNNAKINSATVNNSKDYKNIITKNEELLNNLKEKLKKLLEEIEEHKKKAVELNREGKKTEHKSKRKLIRFLSPLPSFPPSPLPSLPPSPLSPRSTMAPVIVPASGGNNAAEYTGKVRHGRRARDKMIVSD